uniref:LOB domain-containing protein n=1 Tax=Oryza nivara TaxID=4536 RepID=A0A0E0FND6_ORYNI
MRHLQGAEDGVLAGVPARVILHGDEKVRLLNAQHLFGTRNIRCFVQATLPEKRDDLMSSIKYEAQLWARNPQSGATGVMWHLERKVERELAKLSKLRQKLEMCKNLAAKKSILEAKGVGVRQVTSKEQEQERQYQACPARISAWTLRLFVHRSACEIPISQTESRIACMQFFGRAFMAFVGQIQEEAINHDAEDAHYDFFPLQAHLVLDSPRNPHPLGRPPLTRSHNVHG